MPLKSGPRSIAPNIQELMHSFMGTGKIGTSTPASPKAAQKQAVAIAERKAGNVPPRKTPPKVVKPPSDKEGSY